MRNVRAVRPGSIKFYARAREIKMTLLLLEISKQARNYDLREGVKDKRAKILLHSVFP